MSHSKQKIARSSASRPVVGNKQLEEVPQDGAPLAIDIVLPYGTGIVELGGSKMSHKLAPRRNRLETHAIGYYRSSRFLCTVCSAEDQAIDYILERLAWLSVAAKERGSAPVR